MRSPSTIAIVGIALFGFVTPSHSDQRADNIIRRAQAVAQAARTINAAAVVSTSQFGAFTCNIESMLYVNPNKFYIEEWNLDHIPKASESFATEPHQILTRNGKWRWGIDTEGVVTREVGPTRSSDADDVINNFRMVDSPGQNYFEKTASRVYAGKKYFNGYVCDVVEFSDSSTSNGGPFTANLYIDGHHIYRGSTGTAAGAQFKVIYKRFILNKPIPAQTFRFHLPPYVRAWRAAGHRVAHWFTMDPRAARLLKHSRAVMAHLQGISATETTVLGHPASKIRHAHRSTRITTVTVVRPNFASAESWYLPDKPDDATVKHLDTITVSDGRHYWQMWDQDHKYYETGAAGKSGENIPLYTELLRGFFRPEGAHFTAAGFAADSIKSGWCRYVGTKIWNGERYRIVRVHETVHYNDDKWASDSVAFIARDGLIERFYEHDVFESGQVMNTDSVLTTIRLNPPVSRKLFGYKLPVGAIAKAQFPFLAKPKH